ncbi:hypothetical protein M8J76_007442 [Diaphorina citri]|nr:hypothetical protein M8J76_007442 [Diaphorina citri]
MTNSNKIKLVVMGASRVGKSAVTVRYLTKRYIGEYSSSTDMIYRHNTTIDNTTTEVEILDTCKCSVSSIRLTSSDLIDRSDFASRR